MKKKLLPVITSALVILLGSNCAKTVTNPNQNVVLRFIFKVKGSLAIRNDITYFFVMNAPATNTAVFDPTVGPRINAPDLTKGSTFLEGRLPFIGRVAGDLESFWTDFFYLTGTADGKVIIGRGRKDSTGNPVIYERNYISPNTIPVYNQSSRINGYQIEFFLSSLNGLVNPNTSPKTITANLAVSESIDNGNGNIFDSWKNNSPFPIDLTSESQDTQVDTTSNLVLRRLPLRPIPTLPAGVNSDDLNISEYIVRIAK